MLSPAMLGTSIRHSPLALDTLLFLDLLLQCLPWILLHKAWFEVHDIAAFIDLASTQSKEFRPRKGVTCGRIDVCNVGFSG